MISSKEIIEAMMLNELHHNTLFHRLNKYTNIPRDYVSQIVKLGCNDRNKPLVAHFLGLKKYVPSNFVLKLKQENIKCEGQKKRLSSEIKTSHSNVIEQKNKEAIAIISVAVHRCGGGKVLANLLNVSLTVVYSFKKVKDNGYVYVQPQYLDGFLSVLKSNGYCYDVRDFLKMMPLKQRKAYKEISQATYQT